MVDEEKYRGWNDFPMPEGVVDFEVIMEVHLKVETPDGETSAVRKTKWRPCHRLDGLSADVVMVHGD